MNKKVIIALAAGAALLGAITLTLYLISQQQDVRSRADQPVGTTQQSCPTPSQVQNVQVEFPNCAGDICNFTEAACSWSAVSDATKYKLVITQVESAAVVKNEEVDTAVTRVVFPITQNKTYKCDVFAINSCGGAGATGSHSLFCQVDALVEPTPTLPPTTVPEKPTSTPTLVEKPTSVSPAPTIVPAGEVENALALGIGVIILLTLGFTLLAL